MLVISLGPALVSEPPHETGPPHNRHRIALREVRVYSPTRVSLTSRGPRYAHAEEEHDSRSQD